MKSYGELWVPMAKQRWISLIFYYSRATESYGELWGAMGKKHDIKVCTKSAESYGELRRATESYGYLWLYKVV